MVTEPLPLAWKLAAEALFPKYTGGCRALHEKPSVSFDAFYFFRELVPAWVWRWHIRRCRV